MIKKITRNINFLRRLFRHKGKIRNLLESPRLDQLDTIISRLNSSNAVFEDFSPAGHFYSPLPDISAILENEGRIFDFPTGDLGGISLNTDAQINLLEELAGFISDCPLPHKESGHYRYYLDNSYFSYGDGLILYGLMRNLAPTRIIEVGSGFSSALMLDVNEKYFKNSIQLSFIEPYPKRLKELLKREDQNQVRIQEKCVQDVPVAVFEELVEGDILFIDSSHAAKCGSDVLFLFSEVLPKLSQGVIVHIHDIQWPFEYPKKWLMAGRAWNEAYLARAFLQYNEAFEIFYFNSYMAIHHRSELEKRVAKVLTQPSFPMTLGNSSLWLRKVG